MNPIRPRVELLSREQVESIIADAISCKVKIYEGTKEVEKIVIAREVLGKV